ncbi:Potassium channel subfamily K member 2 [Liparis tanakae]|uniref:Potassium channel subfamily K member 2 n=1 Tax=Liparis tanakae TaxID=230148 RepID=A0A4Z2FYP3_9TELE|nr:Potassium channel subfamily K member 2 [Liparis tanakae]
MRGTTLLALLIGVMLYLVMGALVFGTLELPQENLAFEDLLATKNTFLENNSCVTERDFYELVKGVVSAVESGLDVKNLSANFSTRWDLASAFFFCGTIITTIGTAAGFGNLSPVTWYGQLFCVCYALVGIPMFGILLAGVCDHMGTVLRRAVEKVETLFLKREVRPTTVRVISAVLSILIGCLIFLAVPTVVFQKVEDWSFLESLYFVVITLTTVGFGDYVPGGREDDWFFKPLVWLWIVFGLAYFASILTMIGNWLKVLSKRTRAEMEELRAHATDWTQNIQNMSMDFRIPNPMEFNDPFLLQRRRWKRSERRRVRRGAQGTLGHEARGGPENGHLPYRWAGLSRSLSQLQAHASLQRALGAKAGGGAGPGAEPASRGPPAAGLQAEGRPPPHLLARSFSLPAARSTLQLDAAAVPGGSFSGSESPFDSRSDVSFASSASSSFLARHHFQPCCAVGGVEGGGARAALMNTSQERDKLIPAESASVNRNNNRRPPAPGSQPRFAPLAPPPLHMLLPSPPLHAASSASCQLLDFFGENLAYIDESSDTLSDRGQPGAREEKRRLPRKPKRRSMRRQLSHRWSPLQVRRPSADMQPPSNPPTPPPESSRAESRAGAGPTL